MISLCFVPGRHWRIWIGRFQQARVCWYKRWSNCKRCKTILETNEIAQMTKTIKDLDKVGLRQKQKKKDSWSDHTQWFPAYNHPVHPPTSTHYHHFSPLFSLLPPSLPFFWCTNDFDLVTIIISTGWVCLCKIHGFLFLHDESTI